MGARETFEVQVCTDCLVLFANGETPPELGEAEAAEWLAEVDRRTEGHHVAPGTGEGEFSWVQCDTCGSKLGGDRHQAFMWAI